MKYTMLLWPLANARYQQETRKLAAAELSDLFKAYGARMAKEEDDVYRRGRNAKSHTMAKNATVADYRRATGFEALVGYLYLSGQMRRLVEIVRIGITYEREKE